MGTRAYIAIKKPDGTYRAIYNQLDGGLESLGHILHKHFDTKEKVEKLLFLGYVTSILDKKAYYELLQQGYANASEWKELCDCMIHLWGRYEEAEDVSSLTEITGEMISYTYVFIVEENKWYYTKGTKLYPLCA